MNSEEQKQAAEQWLDEAIEQFRHAGPAAGLESRIVAELRARVVQRRRNWVFLAMGAAAAAVVTVLAASLPRAERQAPSTAIQQSRPLENSFVPPRPPSAGNQPQPSRNRLARRPDGPQQGTPGLSANNVAARVRKTEVFPTPTVLNEQGKLLQAYLRQTPQQELMVMAGRQRAAADSDIPDLSIAPIEIKELSPIGEKDRQ
jgi:hypothetical protein